MSTMQPPHRLRHVIRNVDGVPTKLLRGGIHGGQVLGQLIGIERHTLEPPVWRVFQMTLQRPTRRVYRITRAQPSGARK